jgi:rhamnosyltransferase
MKNPLVSVIVRTKNESFWIGKCLHEITNQVYKNYEVIVVDNSSSDKTISIIKKNFKKIKIVNYKSKNFYPGKALNYGISKSKGKLIAMISGHCIPKDKFWIKNLVKNFKNKKVAGVYGKQEPLDFSKPDDVRDLIYLFGKDKKIQMKDPFFHNANSMIRKDLWQKIKFDENTKHIEDRLWAQKQINKKMKIIYEPSASVFHYHGVSHSENTQRVSRISNILTKKPTEKKTFKLVCMAAIQKPTKIRDKYLIKNVLNELKKIKKIKKIFIICNDIGLRRIFKNEKIKFINRSDEIEKDFLGTDYVLKEIYKKFIRDKYRPSHILTFEDIYLFRPKNFFNNLIKNIDDNFDSLVPLSQIKKNNLWQKDSDGKIIPIYKTTIPTSMTQNYIYQEIQGVGTITKSSNFENNGRESSNTKFFEIDSNYALKLNDFLIKNFKLNNE